MHSSTVLFRDHIKEECMLNEAIKSLAQTPDPIIPENLPPPQIYLLHSALEVIAKRCGEGFGFETPKGQQNFFKIPEEIEEKILKCIELTPYEDFLKRIKNFIAASEYWPKKKDFLFNALIAHLEPKTPIDCFEDPASEATDRHHHPSPQPAPTIEKPKKQKPELNPDLKNLPSIALVKHYALVRKTNVFDFILEQSGSLSFAKVHHFIQHKNNYKRSSRGKVIYDASFSWISRELRIHRNTVWRAFHWMAQRKLVTKIGPQDHRKKKNSRWYVCTSMAQNLKLWSMASSDQKKHLQDSPR